MDLSVYGSTGLIGSYFSGLYGADVIPRNELKPKHSKILYLISTTSNQNVYEDPTLDVKTNLLELTKRLDACRKAGVYEFNFVSSWFVYGKETNECKEDAYCKPKGFYSITKLAAENLVIDYCNTFGMLWRIFRLGNVYGGKDKGSEKRNALHKFINDIRDHKDIEIYRDVARDYIHIFDVCRAMCLLLHTGNMNTIYNIGTGEKKSLVSLLTKAKWHLKSPSKITCVDPPLMYNQAISTYMNVDRLFELGFIPLIDIYQGIQDLCHDQKFSTPDRILTEPKFKQLLKL
jgi:nucleoside-diphosphate-sugar epimerase